MRALRRRSSLSDAEVARRMGYGPNGKQQIDRWERGERSITVARLWRYLEAIGATLSDLDGELGGRRSDRRLEEIAQQLLELGETERRLSSE